MKKSVLLALCIVGLSYSGRAQYYLGPSGTGNPNNVNQEDLEYPYQGGLPASWSVVHSGSAPTAQWSTSQNLPFAFQFNGNTVSTFKVSTSGVLTFTSGVTSLPSYINSALPSASIPANSICIWGLAGKGSNDYIMQKTFGTAPNRQHWISFTSYSLPALVNNHYTFWSIVLEETTNAIYIVDQRTSTGITMALTAGIQIASGNAIMIPGSPALNKQAGDNPARTDNRYYTFLPGVQPVRDLKGETILMDDILSAAKGPYEVKLVVKNVGLDTIKSLDLSYSNTGNLKTTSTITNLSIAPQQVDTLTHSIPWAPSAGITTLKSWAENLNNIGDDNTQNDTAFKPITILASSPEHVLLLESFTSSTSLPSKNFNANVETVLGQTSNPVVHLKYPMNWPGTGDPYFTSEGGDRRQFYGVSSLPDLYLDGTNWSAFGSQVNDSIISQAQNHVALVEIEADYYIINKTYCVKIAVNPLINLPAGTYKAYAAIYEQASTQNVKSSGETIFYNIVKKIMPNGNGQTTNTLTAGIADTMSFCYTFNGSYILPANATQPVNLATQYTVEDFANLRIVAWVQNMQTKEVMQTSEALQIAAPIGISENDLVNNLVLYPNPTSGTFYASFQLVKPEIVTLNVVSITGQVVQSRQAELPSGNQLMEVDIDNAPAGVYLVNLQIGQEQIIRKIIVK